MSGGIKPGKRPASMQISTKNSQNVPGMASSIERRWQRRQGAAVQDAAPQVLRLPPEVYARSSLERAPAPVDYDVLIIVAIGLDCPASNTHRTPAPAGMTAGVVCGSSGQVAVIVSNTMRATAFPSRT